MPSYGFCLRFVEAALPGREDPIFRLRENAASTGVYGMSSAGGRPGLSAQGTSTDDSGIGVVGSEGAKSDMACDGDSDISASNATGIGLGSTRARMLPFRKYAGMLL